ncbi:MAG: transglycosylase SLT domain-containing protein [Desulfobulbaceae bacterium]|nr:transglycosylase SLT domain-containing protein [Desulfobulbaceae bacterium]
MRCTGSYIILPLFAVLLLLPCLAGATIYTFVDEDGIAHFSNVPSDPQYRPILNRYPDRQDTEPAGPGVAGVSTVGVPASPDSYDRLIKQAAHRYQVDPHLVKAVIRAESNFDCLARSNKGALGLMQLMPDTAMDMEVADPFDPQDNINGGTRYLSKMLSLFDGNMRLALAAYNAGPAKVIGIGQVPRIKETIDYVRRVQSYYQRYQRTSPADKLWAKADYEPNS